MNTCIKIVIWETCACQGNYRIIYRGAVHSYVNSENAAKEEVNRLKLKAES